MVAGGTTSFVYDKELYEIYTLAKFQPDRANKSQDIWFMCELVCPVVLACTWLHALSELFDSLTQVSCHGDVWTWPGCPQ